MHFLSAESSRSACFAACMFLLAACATEPSPQVATGTPPPSASTAAVEHWATKLCNHSAINYSILSTQPPRALDAQRCIDAPFTASDWAHTGSKAGSSAAGSGDAPHECGDLPVLTLQGDDDPLNYVIDPRTLPAPERKLFDGGRMTLQVEADHNLYWIGTVEDEPRAKPDTQPSGFPVIPTAD